MAIAYAYNDVVTTDELFDLLGRMMAYDGDRFPARNVFHADLRNREKESASLKNTVAMTARNENGDLIGYIRILTDHAYIYYILDVMVDPAYRKHGIGFELMKTTVDECKKRGFIKIFLTAIPGTESFYSKFGFKEGMSPVLSLRGEDYRQEIQP